MMNIIVEIAVFHYTGLTLKIRKMTVEKVEKMDTRTLTFFFPAIFPSVS